MKFVIYKFSDCVWITLEGSEDQMIREMESVDRNPEECDWYLTKEITSLVIRNSLEIVTDISEARQGDN